MQIHPPTGFPEEIGVHLNAAGETPAVYLTLDHYEIVIQSMADADMLADAVREAGRLLLAAGGEH